MIKTVLNCDARARFICQFESSLVRLIRENLLYSNRSCHCRLCIGNVKKCSLPRIFNYGGQTRARTLDLPYLPTLGYDRHLLSPDRRFTFLFSPTCTLNRNYQGKCGDQTGPRTCFLPNISANR